MMVSPRCYQGHQGVVWSLAWSPDGLCIASADDTSSVQVWEAATLRQRCTYTNHRGRVDTIVWSRDARALFSSGEDGELHIWDASTGDGLARLGNGSAWITTFDCSPDGQFIVAASEDQRIQVWERGSGKRLFDLYDPVNGTKALAWSCDGREVLMAGSRSVVLWRVTTGEFLDLPLDPIRGELSAVVWSKGRGQVAAASGSQVRVWDPYTGNEIACYHGHTKKVSVLGWSPDEGCIASSGGLESRVHIWEAAKGKPLLSMYCPGVISLDWSPDGRKLAVSRRSPAVEIYAF